MRRSMTSMSCSETAVRSTSSGLASDSRTENAASDDASTKAENSSSCSIADERSRTKSSRDSRSSSASPSSAHQASIPKAKRIEMTMSAPSAMNLFPRGFSLSFRLPRVARPDDSEFYGRRCFATSPRSYQSTAPGNPRTMELLCQTAVTAARARLSATLSAVSPPSRILAA